MSSTNEELVSLFEEYLIENDKFVSNGNRTAGTRARKALMDIIKVSKTRRQEIQDVKNSE